MIAMRKPRIILAEDHTLVLDALTSLLEPEFDVVGGVRDGHELVEAATALAPDVAIVDISMPQNRICGPRVRLFGSLYQNTKTSCSESSTGFNRAGDGSCRDLALRFVQQVGAPVGCVRHARLPAPIRAVGEYEAQLTVTRLSH